MLQDIEETVMVDIFPIKKDKAEAYKLDRECCAQEIAVVFSSWGKRVERTTLDETDGEVVVAFDDAGKVVAKAHLDPFEVPVMIMAMRNNRLEVYLAAANGISDEKLASFKNI